MWPVLVALKDLDGSGTNREIDEKVIEILGLSEDQQAVMHKNGRHSLVEYRLLWARSVLKRVGAIDNSRRRRKGSHRQMRKGDKKGTWAYHEGEDLGNPALARVAKKFGYTLDELRELL